eukprot:TRINITY_DN391_c0_g1_i1.p1 TRINITY_DN391_c0_g1~~TRINITY_DN391_c0_g1_i1.p1  ORF type:complete len:763 (-),score=183.81 TRINITY_DN391_c0_g1_i1:12-2300(-)
MITKAYVALLVITALLVVLFLSFGIGGFFYIRNLVVDGILDHSLVRENTEGADYFEKNYGKDRGSTYSIYHMWNLTNQDEVMLGGTPHFEEIGPYAYQQKRRRIDAEWYDGGDRVEFTEFSEYIFVPEMSGAGLSEDDVIVNLNQVYAGGLLLASGNEQNLLSLLSGGFLEVVLSNYFLSESYVRSAISSYRGKVLSSALEEIRSYYPNPSDEGHILDLLGNSTLASDCGKYFSNNTCISLFDGLTTGAGLSVSQTQKLIDGSGSYAIYNEKSSTSQEAWSKYCYEQDMTSFSELSSYMEADQTTIDSLCGWLIMVDETRVSDFIVWNYGIEHVSEIGYVEWGTGIVSNATKKNVNMKAIGGVDVTLSYGEMMRELSMDPSLFAISVETCKKIFSHDGGFYDRDTWMGFLVGFMTMGPSVGEQFGLTEQQTMLFMLYYVQGMMVPYAVPTLMGMDKTSGLFVHRDVRGWLFDCYDSTAGAACNLFTSQTESEARALNHRSSAYTGKGDSEDCASYHAYNGTDTLHVWTDPVSIFGTDGTQFRPFLQSVEWKPKKAHGHKTLYSYVPELLRTAKLDFDDEITYKGATVWRYRLSDVNLEPSVLYQNSIYGLMNMTSAMASTVLISKPHFLDSDPCTHSNITGMSPNRELHDTIVDVEPFLGSTFRVHKRLQINLALPDWWSLSLKSHSESPRVLYPVLWLDLGGEACEKEVERYHDGVYMGLIYMRVVVIAGACLAVLSAVGFGITLWRYRKAKGRKGYVEVV